jgi:hypothetical protein
MFLGATGANPAQSASATNTVQFNRDVSPILSENCFVCHGPDKNNRKGKLRLDVREAALEKGAIVPGKPDQSELVSRIFNTNADDLMPPPDSNKKLTAEQKNLLKRWIEQGAQYQPHWSYIKPERPEIPAARDKRWVRNPIDAFILSALEKRGIRPSPEADKGTLIRRLTLDLTGLPPTPREVDAFVKDKSSSAWERAVDRSLASPHFGERMAAPWLDLARFTDTVGYHGDQNQNIFPYRDYVINAFNRNKPFDQFTIEQLAGDLLPNPTTEQRIATGFNRLNMVTREGGAQPKEYLAKYAGDRVRTVSITWLGSTMGCCECHDHKYDPFLTKDFYQMEAFFADIKQWGVYMDYAYTPNPDLKGFDNDHPFPPEIVVDSPYLKKRISHLNNEISNAVETASGKLKSDATAREAFDAWRSQNREFIAQWPDGWASPKPEVAIKVTDAKPATNSTYTVKPDSTVEFGNAEKESTRITLSLSNMWLAAIRLEIVPQEVAAAKPGMKKKRNGTAITLGVTLKRKDAGAETKLTFNFADADQKVDVYSMSLPVIGVKNVWQISPEHDLQTAVWILEKPLSVTNGDTLTVNLGNALVASARVSVTPFIADDTLRSGLDESLRRALARHGSGGSRAETELAHQTYLLGTAWDAEALWKVRSLERDVRECRGGRAFTMVTEARAPLTTRVLPRGNWQNESGEIVNPAVPHFLPQPADPDGRRLTRLDLARWLVSRDNPLTARAVMNRYWKEFFGRGLSAVVDDLGVQGEPPSHPELLDWLAVEFMDSGWDMKHMIKLMVMSETYRQSSNERPDLKEIDPLNRLVAAQNPRRLEAEFVRDNALSIAGLLDPDIGGPSAYAYQPPGYYANLQFPNRDYYPDKDERQYRRGVYTHWQRTFLQPMLANFDAPAREECTASRIISNTPQQALTLLNDPTFVECSRVFAEHLLGVKCDSDGKRIDLAFERALARPAKPVEAKSLEDFLTAQRQQCEEDQEDSSRFVHIGNAPVAKDANVAELAAWTEVCRVILNLHETITRY